jgi:hemerythrin superfamily protein
MDALELLTADHERISRLLRQLQSERSDDGKRAVLSRLTEELNLHTHIEETVFYPAFGKYPEFIEQLAISRREHEEVKGLLAEANEISRDSPQLDIKLSELAQKVEAHAQTEESVFFPRIRQVMKRPEREHMGRILAVAREERLREAPARKVA